MTWTPERRREYARQYRERNREKIREYQREWARQARAVNPEKIREQRRLWIVRNRDKINRRKREYDAQNRDKVNEKARLRRKQNRAKIRAQQQVQRGGRWIKEDRAAMWAAQGGNCYLCGEPLDNPQLIRIDHDHKCCAPNTSCRICRRGLAHHGCNVIIGWANDDPAMLRHIADALEAAQEAFARRRTTAERAQSQLTLPCM